MRCDREARLRDGAAHVHRPWQVVVTKKERRASKEEASARASAETIQVTIDGSSSPKPATGGESDGNNKGPVEMERKSDVAAVEDVRRMSSYGTPRPVVGMEPKIKRVNSKNNLGGTEWNKQAAQLRREAFRLKDKVERSEFKAQLWTAVKKHFTRLSRMRHSLYSLVRPLQADEDSYDNDPLYLRDEQVAQIFWNVVAWDLVMNFVFSQSDPTTEEDGKPMIYPYASPRSSPSYTIYHAACDCCA